MAFINWSADIVRYMGKHLPHWHQSNAIQYITFHLNDSLPQTVLDQIHDFKTSFEENHPKPWDKQTTDDFYNIFRPFEARMLDNGYGSCILRNSEIRKHLSDSLLHGDGTRYDLLAFVIMPNHVHLLMSDLTGEDVNTIIKSIQHFSAYKINRLLGQTGRLWMDDSFDRIVRSLPHLHHCLAYIISNPQYLPPSDYTLYIKPGLYDSIPQ